MYNTFFILHFFGAICVFLAAAITFLGMLGMVFSKKTKTVRSCSYWAMKMGKFWLFSIFFILASSIYLVISRWGLKLPWINVSILMLIVMMALCPTIIRRLIEIHHAVHAKAENTSSLKLMEKARNRALWNSVSIMTVQVAGIIHLMIERLGTLGSLLTFFITLILGFLLSIAVLRLANKLNPIPAVKPIGELMTTR